LKDNAENSEGVFKAFHLLVHPLGLLLKEQGEKNKSYRKCTVEMDGIA